MSKQRASIAIVSILAAAALLGWAQGNWFPGQWTERNGDPELALAATPGEDSGNLTPVLVELFTSEGCSSCPPADTLLTKLNREQSVAGAEIITLGEHVDYWDRLGWPDRFSSPTFTERQTEYAQALRTQAYTPQMVVDGRLAFVGSDARFAERAIRDASREKKIPLEIQALPIPENSDVVRLQARLSQPISIASGQDTAVLLAITETNLTTSVRAGENSGRVLHHSSVVRELRRIANLDSGQEFSTEANIHKDWDRKNLRAVMFIQEERSRRILAAGQVSLEGQPQ